MISLVAAAHDSCSWYAVAHGSCSRRYAAAHGSPRTKTQGASRQKILFHAKNEDSSYVGRSSGLRRVSSQSTVIELSVKQSRAWQPALSRRGAIWEVAVGWLPDGRINLTVEAGWRPIPYRIRFRRWRDRERSERFEIWTSRLIGSARGRGTDPPVVLSAKHRGRNHGVSMLP
jgi:hypothetical protein